MKKVLLALDFEPNAQKVAEIGCSMAKAMNGQVILLHVISGSVGYSLSGYSMIIGNTESADPDQLQFDCDDQLNKISQYFLIFGKQQGCTFNK